MTQKEFYSDVNDYHKNNVIFQPPAKKFIASEIQREQFLREQELQRSMELVSQHSYMQTQCNDKCLLQAPSLYCGSSPVLATLARHVVDDFMFDRNMATGSVSLAVFFVLSC